MRYSYEGIDYLAITVPAGSCTKGHLCKLDTQGRASTCVDGEMICGYVEAVEGDSAAIQVEGFREVKYSGIVPDMGYVGLCSNGKGGVRIDSNGKKYLVVAVNTNSGTVTFKL